jgi:hypothetical protein
LVFKRTPAFGLAWTLLGLTLTLPSTSDGSIRAFSQQELCTLANLIVIGTVEARDPQYMSDGTTIVTTVTLSVDHVITGDPGGTVHVTTLGGQIGNAVQHVGDEPAMPIGSKYLLLMNQPAGSSPPLLIGGIFGARRLDPEADLSEVDMVQEWEEACSEYL